MNRGEQLTIRGVCAELGMDRSSVKKAGGNTFLLNDYILRYHHTNVAVHNLDGSVTLDSGGYRTPTTKERINQALDMWVKGWTIYQHRWVWYLSPVGTLTRGNKTHIFFEDGVTIFQDGTARGAGKAPDKELIKKIKTYAKEFTEALPVAPPSGGDCFGCLFKTVGERSPYDQPLGTDHLLSHMEEKYYVPSLMYRVLRAQGCDPNGGGCAWFWGAFQYEGSKAKGGLGLEPKTYQKWIYNYLYRVLVEGRSK